MNVLFTNIKYDTDGQEIENLPVSLECIFDDTFDVAEQGAEFISSLTGWAVFSFNFTVSPTKTEHKRFRFYISDPFSGSVKGTNSLEVAKQFCSEDFFVVDSATGTWFPLDTCQVPVEEVILDEQK